MKFQLRDVTKDDLPTILKLNEQAIPHVNHLELEQINRFAEIAAYFRVAESRDKLAGFLIALGPETDYPSQYFTWFCRRYQAFLYVDRVVVADWARQRGVARALYRDVELQAHRLSYLLAVDVYSQPANRISLAFHRNYGFEEVGVQEIENGTKMAAKFLKIPEIG